MKRHFTDDEIICFLYDEMNAKDGHEFMDALCIDEELWARYEHFQEIVEQLSDLKYEPSKLSVEKVRTYVYEGQIHDGPALDKIPQPKKPILKGALSTGRVLSVSLNLNAVVLMAVLLFVSVAVTGTFLKLKRGLPSQNQATPTAFVHDAESHFRWDDSYLDVELDRIREKVQGLEKQGEHL